MGRPRVAVVLRYGLDPAVWARRHERGEVVDRTPYAYHLAASAFSLEWSSDRAEGPVARWWRMSVKRVLGFDFVHVWRNRALLKNADAIWTHTEREHLAVALLTLLNPRAYRGASIAQSVWLWDLWPTLSSARRLFFRALVRRHDVELVLSRCNREVSSVAVPGRAVVRLPFGTHFAHPATRESRSGTPTILVIGNDRHRDWDLMLEAARRLPQFDIDVLSLADVVRDLPWPGNVHVRRVDQRRLLYEVYPAATVVVLPLRENQHASGCTVAIEALSAGLPVVASDAGGIDEYLADSGSTLVPLGDVDAFIAAIVDAVHGDRPVDSALPRRRGLSEEDYVARLVSVTRSVLADRPLDPTVDQFVPPAPPVTRR